MKNNLWGHALFLGSKMDPKTHASIMTRYGMISIHSYVPSLPPSNLGCFRLISSVDDNVNAQGLDDYDFPI